MELSKILKIILKLISKCSSKNIAVPVPSPLIQRPCISLINIRQAVEKYPKNS